MKIRLDELNDALFRLFTKVQFPENKARLLAKVHTESTLYGVNSHGLNRVPQFIDHLKQGIVTIHAEAAQAETFGSIERWEGNFGPGIINATKCTNRAIALAQEHGMGLVALRNTNHWMRGGTYGLQAADAGCIAIMFTNTQPNMPPWGGRDSRIGNNPLVVAIPRAEGHVVLDMSLSQFSFGKIDSYKLKGKKLPFAGGWDDNNVLSNDPEKILTKERGLPIGYWKGSALSMVLDMLATLLSAGNSTARISEGKIETGISQVYLCIDPNTFGDAALQGRLLNEIISYTRDVDPMQEGDRVYYPGERSATIAARQRVEGIEVDESVWEAVRLLS